MGIPSQAAILSTHFGSKTVSSQAGFGRDSVYFLLFLRFLGILLTMSGFSWPDIPSVTLGAPMVEVAR